MNRIKIKKSIYLSVKHFLIGLERTEMLFAGECFYEYSLLYGRGNEIATSSHVNRKAGEISGYSY